MTEVPIFHEHSPLEKRRLSRVIREYRGSNFNVFEFPSRDELPEFLSHTSPDAIAIGDGENIAIVVRSTQALRNDPALLKLAGCIAEQSDWRLELIVTNPKSNSPLADLTEREHLNRREIYLRHATARELFHAGYQEAAFLQMWSSIVATLWDIQERMNIPIKNEDIPYGLKQLVSLALISEDEYHLILQALDKQNCLAQGFLCEEIHENFLRSLSDITLRLLKS